MVRISEEEINAVRNRADIVEVIGRYIQVHHQGKTYKAICPFHDDHSPSLSISPDKQIYKCFVCGEGGNVFTFVQNYEKISFPEAVGRVASIIGYSLSTVPEASSKPKDPHKEALYRVLDETIRYSMYELNSSDASLEKEYLEGRGLTHDICEKFQIGYIPTGNKLISFLRAKGYDEKDMVSTNVARIGDRGLSDVFGGRITFPIHDSQGNPIGFSARTIDKSNPSKYINTNETELFVKGNIVYNFHRAKSSARKEGCIYVTEGVTDVIAFAKAGIDNCVCTLGTSCTKQQIQLLKSSSPLLVFCYDGDEPGQAATYKAAKMARAAGCSVQIINNKTGKDPDEIIRSGGVEALKELSKSRISWMEFVLNYFRRHTNFENYIEKKEFIQRSLAEIDQLEDEFDRQHFTEELSSITGMHLTYQPKTKEVTVSAKKPEPVMSVDGLAKAEELILTMMMAHPEAIQSYLQNLGYLTDELRNRAAMTIMDEGLKGGHVDLGRLIDISETADLRNLFTKLASEWAYSLPYDEKLLNGAMRKVNIEIVNRQIANFREQLKMPMNDSVRMQVIAQYQKTLLELRNLIDEDNRREDS